MKPPMNVSAVSIENSNVLVQSLVVPQPLLPADTPAERTQTYFELGNASILAASLGLGQYIDTYA